MRKRICYGIILLGCLSLVSCAGFQALPPEEQQRVIAENQQAVSETAAVIRAAVPTSEPWLSIGETIITSALGVFAMIKGGAALRDAPSKREREKALAKTLDA
jgi:hypothetical protein